MQSLESLISNKSVDFIFVKQMPDIVGFLKIYSFMHLCFQHFEKRECMNETVQSTLLHLKVSGPFVETLCVFQCIKNINAEMWA